jgi:hypothetical protein
MLTNAYHAYHYFWKVFAVETCGKRKKEYNTRYTTAEHQPTTTEHQPTTAEHQPTTAEHQPTTAEHQPTPE